MKTFKIVGILVAGLAFSMLSVTTSEARGGHSHHCGVHKHVDMGTNKCVWNYGYKKPHKMG